MQFACVLIEEIALRAKEMTGEKEMVCCVRGYHIYKSIWAAAIGKVLVCCRWKIFIVKKLHSRKIFSHVICVRKYFLQRKKVNYNICSPLHVTINGSIRPLSRACGHLVMCLLRLLLQTGLQLLHGYLTGLLTILGALKKPP